MGGLGDFTWEAFLSVCALLVTIMLALGKLVQSAIKSDREKIEKLDERLRKVEIDLAENTAEDGARSKRIGRIEQQHNGS